MDGITRQQLNLDADAEQGRQPNDPTQLEIRLACLAIHAERSQRGRQLRRQMSRYRWQAPHCPKNLARLMLESA
jgi:hypothetical protein